MSWPTPADMCACRDVFVRYARRRVNGCMSACVHACTDMTGCLCLCMNVCIYASMHPSPGAEAVCIYTSIRSYEHV